MTRDGRRPIVGTSWKMHLVPSAVAAYLDALVPAVRDIADRDLFVLPSFPAIPAVQARLTGTNVAWGAQDVHADDFGAHTGDVSAPMLADLGCRYVEVGHWERRRDHGETRDLVAAKVAAVLRWGMRPIVCVGETLRAEPVETPGRWPTSSASSWRAWRRGPGAGRRRLRAGVGDRGGGHRRAAREVGAIHRGLRAWLDALAPEGRAVRIIYGGSVDLDNASSLLAQPAVDGLFVGRRALDPLVFAAIAGTPVKGV